ncbi:MAG: tRNA pseudouridine(55) synthase TruB [Lentisphaerae bacterium RIFOXYB12_FULL_65_16]|nr:MAG: tRNA pseudouridine(55) synthase TruB [Lentisphaerae bacterium RIFOXYA12_64_32]OGV91304.1 MAG: tRNA pseudouridine(55) synthase TruB [Lentisphaerae bacterium RIFOXYB12_FULL_65_16]
MNTPDKELAESGILLVDKPTDWTSHDVVNFVRRRFDIRKVGHCGTLDPIATGLLVLLLGRATRLSGRLTSEDKIYAGTMRLGIETSTDDRAGTVLATKEVTGITPEQVRAVAAEFTGDIQQIPPMVSAKKKDGKPLYKLARQGKTVERDPQAIFIHYLKLNRIALPDIDFEVHCSKGTYVRTLCADIGRRLGCGGHMLDLRRLRSGAFELTNAHTIEAIRGWDREKLLSTMTPLANIVVSWLKP